jgi:hypothetical protein
VNPRFSLDDVERTKILDSTGTRNSDPSVVSARSQSLYRLRYLSSYMPQEIFFFANRAQLKSFYTVNLVLNELIVT